MTPTPRNYLSLLTVAVVVAFIGCTPAPVADGGGTDVANGKVTGVIIDTARNPVPGALVRLYSSRHNPMVLDGPYEGARGEDFTDDSGRYVIDSLLAGDYALEADHEARGLAGVRFGVTLSLQEPLYSSVDTVQSLGRIKIELPESVFVAGGHLTIPGTSFYHLLTPRELTVKEFILDSVPVGLIPVLYYRTSAQSDTVIRAVSRIEFEYGIAEVEFEGTDTLGYHEAFDD